MVSKISIAHLIWYLVPGLCAVAYFIFPIAIFNPQLAKSIVTTLTPLGLVVFGVLFGFAIDGLRMYRYRIDYDKDKAAFFRKLQEKIGTVHDPYYILSTINDMAIKDNNGSISLHHAIWIMHGNMASLSYIMSLVWLLIVCYIGNTQDNSEQIAMLNMKASYFSAVSSSLAVSFVFYILGRRMMKISAEDQNTTNNMFLGFAIAHRDEIRKKLSLI